MIITRDEGLIDKISLSLRYRFIEGIGCRLLSKCLEDAGIEHEVKQPSRWSNKFKVNINHLDLAVFDPDVIRLINEKLEISPADYDFFLGITSAYQLGGFLQSQLT